MKRSSWLGYAVGIAALAATFTCLVLGLWHYTEETTHARKRAAEGALADFRELLESRLESIPTVVSNGLGPCLSEVDGSARRETCVGQWLASTPGYEKVGASGEANDTACEETDLDIDVSIANEEASLLSTAMAHPRGGGPTVSAYSLRIDVGYLAGMPELARFAKVLVTDDHNRLWFVAYTDPEELLPNAVVAHEVNGESVEIRGRSYRMLTESIELASAIRWRLDSTPIKSLKIVGYAPVSVTHDDVIPPAQLRYGLLALITLVCALPVIKLVLIGRNERLTRLDLAVMVVCLGLSLAVSAIALTERQTYSQFHAALRDDAEGVRRLASSRVVGLLHHSFALIRAFKNELCAVGNETSSDATDAENCLTRQVSINERPYVLILFGEKDGVKDGAIERRWTFFSDNLCREIAPPGGQYKDRAYYQQADTDRLWTVDGVSLASEVIRSRVSGRAEVVTAVPIECEGEPRIAAVSTPPATGDWILPPGVEFAVVDQSGRTLLHSTIHRSMRGRLPADVVEALRVNAGAPAWRSTTIDGRNVDFSVAPIAWNAVAARRLPWQIVVFVDGDAIEHLRIQVWASAGWKVARHVAGILMIVILAWLVLPDLGLWPRASSAGRYWAMSAGGVITIVAILALLPVTFVLPEPFYIGLVSGGALVGVGQLLRYVYQRPVSGAKTSGWQRRWLAGYAASVAVGLTCLVVLPTVLITQGEFRSAVMSRTEEGQRSVGAAVRTTLGLSSAGVPYGWSFGWSSYEASKLRASRLKIRGDQGALGNLDEYLIPNDGILSDAALRAHVSAEAMDGKLVPPAYNDGFVDSRPVEDPSGRIGRAYVEWQDIEGPKVFALAAYNWPANVVQTYRAIREQTVGGFLVLVCVIAYVGVRRVWRYDDAILDATITARRTVFVYRRRCLRPGSGQRVIDLTETHPCEASLRALVTGERVRIRGIYGAVASDESGHALALMERLVQAPIDLTMVAERDILTRCIEESRGAASFTSAPANDVATLHRWERVLDCFERREVKAGSLGGAQNRWCGWSNSGTFWDRWARLSDLEKLTLIQVAREGIVNPRRKRWGQELIARGFLRFDGMIDVVGENRERIASAETPETIARWEQSDATAVVWAIQLGGVVAVGAALAIVNRAYPGVQALISAGLASMLAIGCGAPSVSVQLRPLISPGTPPA